MDRGYGYERRRQRAFNDQRDAMTDLCYWTALNGRKSSGFGGDSVSAHLRDRKKRQYQADSQSG